MYIIQCLVLIVMLAVSPWDAAAQRKGSSGLPPGGNVSDCVINTAPGTGTWQACPGAAGGDSVSVDGVAVVDPNFDSTGDIDFVNTANVVTGNVKADSVALGTDTTGNYAAGDAEAGAALTGDTATAFFSAGTIEDARLPSSMADKVFTGSILLPNATAVPGTCSIGMIYFDNDATAGVNLYGCTASNTWTLLGDGGGAGSVATDAIFDAVGDIVVGTGANTAGRLARGTPNQVLKTNAGGTDIEWGADSTGGSPTFDSVATGSNTTAVMTCGAGCSVVPTSTGVIAATAIRPTILTVNAGNAPYTGLVTDAILLCDTTAAVRVINLPAATGKILYHIKYLGANTCTINRAGTDTIDGGASAVLRNQYEAITLASDGTSSWSLF